jgi:branched-subunit amino acid ABC-type transport system permease component
MFALGYALQRIVINRASHGKDENILLVTLGIAIVLENLALLFFKSDTRSIDTAYTLSTVAIGPAMIAVPKLVAFAGALVVSASCCGSWAHRPRPRHPRRRQGESRAPSSWASTSTTCTP